MTSLPPRVDWRNQERPADSMEVASAEGIAARVRSEVAEIRAAAEQLSTLGPFEKEVAGFLTVQAVMLERAGATPLLADTMRPDDDTREQPGMFPTPARSALLIARAHLARK